MPFSAHSIANLTATARDLGFMDMGVTDTDLSAYIPRYRDWIARHYHGQMHYMTAHGDKRLYPEQLVPGTRSVIVVAHNYFNRPYPYKGVRRLLRLRDQHAVISQYAVGRDYHKTVKAKLKALQAALKEQHPEASARLFTDSAPVLEKPLAEKAGIGSIGKNGMLIHPQYGSYFFIGVIYTSLALPDHYQEASPQDVCGSCRACIQACPTGAILPGKILDARRCIAYLTIENRDAIPEQYRKAIGTRIYGCDDCQMVCPWNRYSQLSADGRFFARRVFQQARLVDLLHWDEETFLAETRGSAIRRVGYEGWIRNIAVALGNAPYALEHVHALRAKLQQPVSDMVREHLHWALHQLGADSGQAV